jgi:hypothetical protein
MSGVPRRNYEKSGLLAGSLNLRLESQHTVVYELVVTAQSI